MFNQLEFIANTIEPINLDINPDRFLANTTQQTFILADYLLISERVRRKVRGQEGGHVFDGQLVGAKTQGLVEELSAVGEHAADHWSYVLHAHHVQRPVTHRDGCLIHRNDMIYLHINQLVFKYKLQRFKT